MQIEVLDDISKKPKNAKYVLRISRIDQEIMILEELDSNLNPEKLVEFYIFSEKDFEYAISCSENIINNEKSILFVEKFIFPQNVFEEEFDF